MRTCTAGLASLPGSSLPRVRSGGSVRLPVPASEGARYFLELWSLAKMHKKAFLHVRPPVGHALHTPCTA